MIPKFTHRKRTIQRKKKLTSLTKDNFKLISKEGVKIKKLSLR